MNFKSFIVGVLLTFSGFVTAEGVKLPVDVHGVITNRPVCSAFNIPVQYHAVNRLALSQHNASTAAAVRHPLTGQPTILFNLKSFMEFSPEFQMWVFSHECAHWKLGHLSKPYNTPINGLEYEERDADCIAAKDLVSMGFSVDQLNIVLEDIEKEQQRLHDLMAAPPAGVIKRPHDGKQRRNHAKTCMDEAHR